MKRKMLFLGIVGCLTSTIMATLTTDFIGFKAFGYSNYTCADITFGETMITIISASTDLVEEKAIDKVVNPVSTLASSEYTLTDWTYSAYKASLNGNYYPVKVGSSSKGTYSGSFSLTLKNYVCSRAIIYATGWKGVGGSKTQISIGVNDLPQQNIEITSKDATEYKFSPYVFENINSSVLTIKNNVGATGDRRLLISKIVLKLHLA